MPGRPVIISAEVFIQYLRARRGTACVVGRMRGSTAPSRRGLGCLVMLAKLV